MRTSIARVVFALLVLVSLTGEAWAQGALLPDAFPQFFNSNGNPLTSGTLSFFLTGTTTPTTVYSDVGLTTPTGVAGVVTLNGAGRPPTAIYVAVQPYKVVLKDSGGNVIATRDPVSGANYLATSAAQTVSAAQTASVLFDVQSGTINNWVPTGWTTAGRKYVSWAGASDTTITGLAGGVIGMTVTIRNTSPTNNLFFPYNSGSSAPGNRYFNYATSIATPIAAGGTVSYTYDGGEWIITQHEQGAQISYVPTWTGAGNGTVAGNYRLVGKNVFWEAILVWGTTTNVPSFMGVTLPFAPAALNTAASHATGLVTTHLGTFIAASVFAYLSGTTLIVGSPNTTFINAVTGWTNTYPITFAPNDLITVGGWYQIS